MKNLNIIKGAGRLTGAMGAIISSVLGPLLAAQQYGLARGLSGRSKPKQTFLRQAQLPARVVTPKMARIRDRKAAQAARTAAGQSPKVAEKARTRRPAAPKHDSAGFAITLVGREPRRVWLAGISAQRGF